MSEDCVREAVTQYDVAKRLCATRMGYSVDLFLLATARSWFGLISSILYFQVGRRSSAQCSILHVRILWFNLRIRVSGAV